MIVGFGVQETTDLQAVDIWQLFVNNEYIRSAELIFYNVFPVERHINIKACRSQRDIQRIENIGIILNDQNLHWMFPHVCHATADALKLLNCGLLRSNF